MHNDMEANATENLRKCLITFIRGSDLPPILE